MVGMDRLVRQTTVMAEVVEHLLWEQPEQPRPVAMAEMEQSRLFLVLP